MALNIDPSYTVTTTDVSNVGIFSGTSSNLSWFAKTQCLVCESETDGYLCALCRAALLQVRKQYVAETVQDLLDTGSEEYVRLHQGLTRSGGLTHAVRLIRRGEYQPRSICGVRIVEAKARKFEAADEGTKCSRCVRGLGTA